MIKQNKRHRIKMQMKMEMTQQRKIYSNHQSCAHIGSIDDTLHIFTKENVFNPAKNQYETEIQDQIILPMVHRCTRLPWENAPLEKSQYSPNWTCIFHVKSIAYINRWVRKKTPFQLQTVSVTSTLDIVFCSLCQQVAARIRSNGWI